MEAVALVDYPGNGLADTPRGAHASAPLAADALVPVDAVPRLADGLPAKGEALAEGGLLGEVEVLPLAPVELEHLQGLAAPLRGVDARHVGILGKDLRQPLATDAPHRPPQGDGHSGESVRPLHPGEGRKGPGRQPVVKGLATGGQEIEAPLVPKHQIDYAGLGQSMLVQGGKNHRVDLFLEHSQNGLCGHGASSPLLESRAEAPGHSPGTPHGLVLQAVLLGRIAGEVGDHRVGIRQVKHLEDGVVGGLILALDDGVLDAHLLDGHVVLKGRLPAEADPRVGGAGHGDLDVGVGLHVLVDLLSAVGAEPQLAVLLPGEHEGAALGLTVPAHGGQVLHGVLVQEFHDFVHDVLPPNQFLKGGFPFDGSIVTPNFMAEKYAQ